MANKLSDELISALKRCIGELKQNKRRRKNKIRVINWKFEAFKLEPVIELSEVFAMSAK